ncbi:MAG: peptidylprolyl isomerase [Candidatus Lloydbacteria bacterium RIFCSPHIGHO2_01_FULL_49_22]|uniref:Peptidyl-prolyl cis-trans isomerase n=1 Tax=Candidatus Lloydbacteria bacterium RIFCSPHIGHO2_01_FULL_49_22 TaxID=1798658 RepID=A0A1G2CVA2_9BACT|nr:MAG: peptidylprolyl isomerase [Candidatus Lloydbacteria bacterium RIFCSPHIGHO2_01_FULL_49_22]OGZ10427.1 MAG: peptidylprolyl isomerase [Candidatus Lloydbacteria bacterium RIFCSPHIGHO2_02_FULL_50_18]
MNTAIEGLQIDILTPGTGAGAESGQTLIVDYTGMLTDGTIFDSSIPRGQPFPVNLGRGEVIRGWDLGLVGMKVGEKRKLTISSELAYGKEGFSGVIPPNATLVFEITLKAIQ